MAIGGGSRILGRFFGRTVSEAAAFGAGIAIGPVLGPPVQELRNVINAAYPVAPPDAVLLAQGVAQGQIDADTARTWASYNGFGDQQFDAMVAVFDSGPGVAQAFELWRRGQINEAGFRRAARREGLEQEWIDALVPLKRRLLSPAELANAVVQGFRSLDDAADDAALHGIERADFQTMVDVTGLPPGPETLQEWTRRGIITQAELAQGVREGHIKTKYVDEYLESLKRVLSAPEYASLHLRGWITEAQMNAGGALTGFDAEAMRLLYLNRGRPATTRQVHIGWARGGRLEGAGSEREAFEKAVAQSNVRTEYTELLWAQRYTYPSAFVIRALASDGTFDRDTTEKVLIESGWNPDYAALAADKWAGATAAGPTAKWADRAASRVFTEAWNDYLDGNADEDALRALLAAVGAGAAEQDSIVQLADAVLANTIRDLTQAQILKLYKKSVWTREKAQAALEGANMTSQDASDLLDSV